MDKMRQKFFAARSHQYRVEAGKDNAKVMHYEEPSLYEDSKIRATIIITGAEESGIYRRLKQHADSLWPRVPRNERLPCVTICKKKTYAHSLEPNTVSHMVSACLNLWFYDYVRRFYLLDRRCQYKHNHCLRMSLLQKPRHALAERSHLAGVVTEFAPDMYETFMQQLQEEVKAKRLIGSSHRQMKELVPTMKTFIAVTSTLISPIEYLFADSSRLAVRCSSNGKQVCSRSDRTCVSDDWLGENGSIIRGALR